MVVGVHSLSVHWASLIQMTNTVSDWLCSFSNKEICSPNLHIISLKMNYFLFQFPASTLSNLYLYSSDWMKIVKKRSLRTLDLMIYVFILNQIQDLFKVAWIDDQDWAKLLSLLSMAMNSYIQHYYPMNMSALCIFMCIIEVWFYL
jgi:hypothetical protein